MIKVDAEFSYKPTEYNDGSSAVWQPNSDYGIVKRNAVVDGRSVDVTRQVIRVREEPMNITQLLGLGPGKHYVFFLESAWACGLHEHVWIDLWKHHYPEPGFDEYRSLWTRIHIGRKDLTRLGGYGCDQELRYTSLGRIAHKNDPGVLTLQHPLPERGENEECFYHNPSDLYAWVCNDEVYDTVGFNGGGGRVRYGEWLDLCVAEIALRPFKNPRKKEEFFANQKSATDPDKATCPRCGNDYLIKDMVFDRIHPGAKGGKYEDGNVQLLCYNCNLLKRDKTE